MTVANDDRLGCSGMCPALDVIVDSEPFRLECYALVLGGYDLILNTQWLCSLGGILCDFMKITMSCSINGQCVT